MIDVIQHKVFRSGCQQLLLTVRNYAVEQFTISTSWPYEDWEILFLVRIIADEHDAYGQPFTYKPDDCYISFHNFKGRFLDYHGFSEVEVNEQEVQPNT